VQTWDFIVPVAAFLDREDGRMRHRAVFDAKLIEVSEKLFRRRAHHE
jgi:hypothetical protein